LWTLSDDGDLPASGGAGISYALLAQGTVGTSTDRCAESGGPEAAAQCTVAAIEIKAMTSRTDGMTVIFRHDEVAGSKQLAPFGRSRFVMQRIGLVTMFVSCNFAT
jgi:hypothetical protein